MADDGSDGGGEVVNLRKAKIDHLVTELNRLTSTLFDAEMEGAVRLGELVLDGHDVTQQDAEDCGELAGLRWGEWTPGTPLDYADLAAFARAYPDLIRLWWPIGTAKIRILSHLSRPELDVVAAQGERIPLPGRDEPRRLINMPEELLFGYVCLVPPAGVDAEEQGRRYRRRLEALEALYDQARARAWPDPGFEQEFEEEWGYAEWALETAWTRLGEIE